MKKISLYLHLGYPRTGSKTLQFHLFPLHKNINYIGRFPREKEPHLKFIYDLILFNDLQFEENKKSILEEFNKIKLYEDKVNLISDEFIILHQCIYNYEATVERTVKRFNEICIKKQLRLKVFFNIRNQKDIIKSLYFATNPEFGHSLKFNSLDLINHIKSIKTNNEVANFLEVFNYEKIISKLEKIIGTENLKILIYEEFKDNNKLYIKNLVDYLGIDYFEAESLLKNKHEHKKEEYMNEEIAMNNNYNIIKAKLIKNFIKLKFNPLKLKQYIRNILRLLNNKSKLSSDEKKKQKELLKNSMNFIDENELLIKSYFEMSNKNLNLKLKSSYFF